MLFSIFKVALGLGIIILEPRKMTEATAPKLHRNIYYFESGPNLRTYLADANGLKRDRALPPYM